MKCICNLSVVYILIFYGFIHIKCYEDLSALEGVISNELKQSINESMYQRLQLAYIELLLKPLESGLSKTYYSRHVSSTIFGPVIIDYRWIMRFKKISRIFLRQRVCSNMFSFTDYSPN